MLSRADQSSMGGNLPIWQWSRPGLPLSVSASSSAYQTSLILLATTTHYILGCTQRDLTHKCAKANVWRGPTRFSYCLSTLHISKVDRRLKCLVDRQHMLTFLKMIPWPISTKVKQPSFPLTCPPQAMPNSAGVHIQHSDIV